MSKGVHKRWSLFNLPDGTWRPSCPKEQVIQVVKNFLTEEILKD